MLTPQIFSLLPSYDTAHQRDLRYKGLSLMKGDFFGPFVQNVRKFRKGTFGYEGLIDPVPSGPLYPKSAVHDRGQQ